MYAQNKTAMLQFLGTGSSSGIPVIGCSCRTCMSKNPKNNRWRSSALISYQGKKYLIDSGPDFRAQALKFDVDRVDGLFLTHTHYDHIGGFEELRIYNHMQDMAIPCVLSKNSFQEIQSLYYYHFQDPSGNKNFTAKFDFQILEEPFGVCQLDDFCFRYTTYYQGEMPVLGFRFGDLAYLTDIKIYDASILEFLRGVKTLVISALRFTSSALHFTIDEAVDFIAQVKPDVSYFIHISHDVEEEHAQTLLPHNIFLAHDGLKIHFGM